MRAGPFLACVSLGIGAACPAQATELRDESAQLAVDVSAAGAKTCVVYPASMRDHGCDGVDLSRYPAVGARTQLAVLVFPDWQASIELAVSYNPFSRAWTRDEADDTFERALRVTRSLAPDAVYVDETTRLTVGDLQLHRRTLRTSSVLERLDMIEGRDVVVALHVVFPQTHENEGISIEQATLRSLRLPSVPPLRTEIAACALRLLAGVPVIAALAFVRTRKKKEPSK